ncbi:DUF393 domain-containing protein [Aeromonas veronii]|uniref:thiol-disulfide oxidoreductase DCC family protein n=1 Tax=Aeromonas veronii TaxID=654 RepID=UPI001F1D587E|nr:DCC1-like thiol-disulfide oxidoreductase family protein [Aeromonas veronii]MCF5891994.1 DUF393 domain-containing protein [Aeromonas veronii]
MFLIDGDCTLCNRITVWILNKRNSDEIYFYPLQSSLSQDFLASFCKDNEPFLNSSYLVTRDGVFKKSMAFFKLTRKLKKPYSLLSYLRFIPRCMTDVGYDLVAKTRYSFFGKQQKLCELSSYKHSQFMLTDDEATRFFNEIRKYNENK